MSDDQLFLGADTLSTARARVQIALRGGSTCPCCDPST